MKKIFYLAIAALAFAACARELAPEAESNLPKVKVSIKAILEQEDVTKAEINMSNGTASWEAGDQIAVHTKNGKLATLEAESAGTSVTFSGTVDAGDDIEDGAIAYYPASIAIEGNDAKVNMPASYGSPVLSAKGFPLKGVLSEDGAIVFKHIGALLKVTVNNVPASVTSLVLTPAGDFSVSGQLAVDNTNAAKPKCVLGDIKNSVTVNTSSTDRTTSACVFYIPLPTGTLTGGFAIELKNGTEVVSTKTTNSDFTIGRAKVIKMKAFTPEGNGSEWYLAGKFNNWSTTANQMTTVVGHEEWKVARNITLPDYSGEDQGFKFFKNEGEGVWKGGNCSALHTEYSADGSSNIDYTHSVSYDIYYNPTSNKFFLAYPGEPWNRTIYLLTDMELSDPTEYKLHVYSYADGSIKNSWPGAEGVATVISGIPYTKYEFSINNSDYIVAGRYNCILNNNGDSSDKRYDFTNGPLVVTNNDGGDYYLSYSGKEFDAISAAGNNTMTQFTDPAKPQGQSNWGAFVGGSITKMHWDDGPVLVVNNYLLTPTTELKLNFNYQWVFYGPSTSTVTTNTDFSVSRSNTGVFTVPGLDGNYLCDIYLDIFNKTARIVPLAKNDDISLFFGISDGMEPVYLYTWNGYEYGAWVNEGNHGAATTYQETINGIKYYKATVPGNKFWGSSVKFLINDNSHWQTDDFTTADWSGYKSEYWFVVNGKVISQLPGKPSALVTPVIDGKMSDWDNYPDLVTGDRLASVKAAADETNLYIYQRWSNEKCTYSKWNSYQFVSIDNDNNDATGPSSNGEVLKGANAYWKFYFYFDTSNKYNLVEYKQWNSTTSGWDNVTDFTGEKFNYKENTNIDAYEIEFSVPLSKIGAAAGTDAKIIKIGIYGYTPNLEGVSTSFKANYFAVTIPAKSE